MDRQDFDLSRLKEIVLRSPRQLQRRARDVRLGARARSPRRVRARPRFYAQRALQKSRDLGLEELDGGVAQPARQPRAPREPLRRGARPCSRKRSTARGRGRQRRRAEAAVVADNLGYCHIALDAVTGRAAARAALAHAAREPRRAAGDGLSLPRSLLRLAQARAARRGRGLGRARARARQGVRPQRRRQERALPAGRDVQRDGPRATRPTSTTTRSRTTTRTSRP